MGVYDNSTSPDIGYVDNITDYQHEDGSSSTGFILDVVAYVFIAAGLLSVLVAICAVFSLVRKDTAAPIYVINLFIADLIQLCSRSVLGTNTADNILEAFYYLFHLGLLASVGFMVCISLERYLAISWPLWYRFSRTNKIYLMVCVGVWVLPLVVLLPVYFRVDSNFTKYILAVFFLLPFPVLIFSLGGTLKALSASISVPPDEKRRIVAMLVLVLLIYTLLILPSIILFMVENTGNNLSLRYLTFITVKLSPIADSFLYVFLKKGGVDKVLASVCSRIESNDINPSTTVEN